MTGNSSNHGSGTGDSMQFRLGSSKQLLRLGLSGPGRPIDDLVQLLEKVDPASYLGEQLRQHDALAGAEGFPDGAHPLPQLEALKEEAKQTGSTAGYFVAVAAALVEHGAAISSAPPDELRDTLLDLASVTAGAWQQFWTTAVRRLEEIDR